MILTLCLSVPLKIKDWSVLAREQKGWQEKGKEKNGGKKIEDGKK